MALSAVTRSQQTNTTQYFNEYFYANKGKIEFIQIKSREDSKLNVIAKIKKGFDDQKCFCRQRRVRRQQVLLTWTGC